MDKSSKKRIIAITVVAILLMGAIAIFSYALWTRDFSQETTNIGNTSCFDVKYSATNGMDLENTYPMTDADGLKTKPYSITITNNCDSTIKYSVVANESNSSSTLSTEYVKLSVNKLIPKLLNSYKNVEPTISGYNKANQIYEDYLYKNQSYKIDVYEWLDSNVTYDQVKGKSFKSKITVTSVAVKTPSTLAATIRINNPLQTYEPDFKKGSPYNSSNKIPINNGDGLFSTDDMGGIAYYFRGAVENNNVTFAGMNWKILRINSDGSIRIMLTNTISQSAFNEVVNLAKYVGYTYDNDHACTKSSPCISDYKDGSFTSNYGDRESKDSTIKKALEDWYINNLAEDYNDKIILSTYCNDSSFYTYRTYGTYNRVYGSIPSPSLVCPDPTDYQSTENHNYGGIYKLKIGLITYDELAFAGLRYSVGYSENMTTASNYIYKTYENIDFWTMSPMETTQVLLPNTSDKAAYVKRITIHSDGTYHNLVSSQSGIVPVVNLKPDVSFVLNGTGNPGTTSNPYVIK